MKIAYSIQTLLHSTQTPIQNNPRCWVGTRLTNYPRRTSLTPPPLRKTLVTPLVGLVGVDLANTQDRHPCHKIGRIAGINIPGLKDHIYSFGTFHSSSFNTHVQAQTEEFKLKSTYIQKIPLNYSCFHENGQCKIFQ